MLGRGERFAHGAQTWIAKHCCSSLPLGFAPAYEPRRVRLAITKPTAICCGHVRPQHGTR